MVILVPPPLTLLHFTHFHQETIYSRVQVDSWPLPCFAAGLQSLSLDKQYTDKKEKKISHIYKEIQKGAFAKSNKNNSFLIYD
jgi:hypothetical protein